MRKRHALLLMPLAVVLLTAAKCGEAAKDSGPETVTATIDAKYPAEVPIPGGKGGKCSYGSFNIYNDTGQWRVCAPSLAAYNSAKVGDVFTRSGS